jgi:hypothetical protein
MTIHRDRPRQPGRPGRRNASREEPRRSPVVAGAPAPGERIRAFADAYGLTLPAAWQHWCEEQGWLEQPDEGWELLGLRPAPSGMDAAAMLAGMRLANRKVPGGFPADLIPVERLPERQLACLKLDGSNDPPVVLIDLDDPGSWADAQLAADRFSQFAAEFTEQASALRGAMGFLRHAQRAVQTGKRAAGQAPRPDDWRAYRFCSQNVVIAIIVLRHNRDDNVLDVGACLVTALSRLAKDAPARAVCTLLLAESYRAGGDLSLRFLQGTRPGAGHVPVPWPIARWAARCGADVDRSSGVVPADAARRLFIESIQVGDHLRRRLRDDSMRAEAAAICYGMASGLWAPAEVEVALGWSAHPGRLLRGVTDPLDRACFSADLLDVRSALLVASLVRRVAAGPGGQARLDVEDAAQPVDLTASGDGTCLVQSAVIELADWSPGPRGIPSAGRVRLAVADAEPDQLRPAIDEAVARVRGYTADVRAVLCPRDLLAVERSLRDRLVAEAASAEVHLLAAPEYTPSLTIQAADKLSRARTARQ